MARRIKLRGLYSRVGRRRITGSRRRQLWLTNENTFSRRGTFNSGVGRGDRTPAHVIQSFARATANRRRSAGWLNPNHFDVVHSALRARNGIFHTG